MNTPTPLDIQYIKQVIELSDQSFESGEMPFSCLIVKDDKVISSSINGAGKYITDHAEILAMNKAKNVLESNDLSSCTLYSNCEPCPMCSFMIREYKISKVVFSVYSPYMGGISKYPVLNDLELEIFYPIFDKPPIVIGGILEEEGLKVFNKSPLWMFGKDVKSKKI